MDGLLSGSSPLPSPRSGSSRIGSLRAPARPAKADERPCALGRARAPCRVSKASYPRTLSAGRAAARRSEGLGLRIREGNLEAIGDLAGRDRDVVGLFGIGRAVDDADGH